MSPRRTGLKGHKKQPRQMGPQTERDLLFCERWLIHFDKDRAFREAGFTQDKGAGNRANSKLKKFADYLQPLREAKARLIAERLVIDSQQVLDAMVKKVFFDPTGFYERSAAPLTHWVKVADKQEKVEEVLTWDGRPVYGERMKPYSELTAEQQAVVEITSAAGEQIKYRLPNIREQHMYFTSIGRQFGMFAEKLILERHNHQHQHHHLSFDNVPTAKIQSLTRQLLPLVDLEFAQMLGYTPEDVEEASREGGVLMPEKSGA
jgi:hypothetical protein